MYLHGAPYAIAPSQQTHIPMLMWFSNDWTTHNATQITCLMQQKSKELSQDNLFPSLLKLLDIKTHVIHQQDDTLQHCQSQEKV